VFVSWGRFEAKRKGDELKQTGFGQSLVTKATAEVVRQLRTIPTTHLHVCALRLGVFGRGCCAESICCLPSTCLCSEAAFAAELQACVMYSRLGFQLECDGCEWDWVLRIAVAEVTGRSSLHSCPLHSISACTRLLKHAQSQQGVVFMGLKE